MEVGSNKRLHLFRGEELFSFIETFKMKEDYLLIAFSE